MNTSRPFRVLLFAFTLAGWNTLAGQTPPMPVTVPPHAILMDEPVNLRAKTSLDDRYRALRERREALHRRVEGFNRDFAGRTFPDGSPEALAGAREQAWLSVEWPAYRHDTARFAVDVDALLVDRERQTALVVALARSKHWDPEEIARVRSISSELRGDGDRSVLSGAIKLTWDRIEGRDGNVELAREAAAGEGPQLSDIGTQSFNDCTIFAVASAAGMPYGAVAAQATQMIRDAAWRGQADRDDPQGAIERWGLLGDEVILLAETFGRARLVPSGEFAAVLREGLPVMVCVNVVDDDLHLSLHETVLSRVFRHEDETWYEMIDSNTEVTKRRYLSSRELFILLEENGVAYQPEAGSTVRPLR